MNRILTILFVFLSFLGIAQHDTLVTFGGYFVSTDGGTSLIGIPCTPTILVNNVTISSGSATLTASGGTSYVWSNASTGSSISVSPTTTTTYTVTGTNLASCTGTSQGVVAVSGGGLPVAGATLDLESDLGILQSGGYVYQWTDQTSNSLVFSQSTGAYQPSYTTSYTPTGKPALYLDNANDFMTMASPSTLGDMLGTWFMLYNITASNTTRHYLLQFLNTYNGFYGLYNGSPNQLQWNNDGIIVYNQSIPFPTRLESFTIPNSSSDAFYINGVNQSLNTDSPPIFLGICHTFNIGSGGGAYPLGGYVMALVYYPTILSTANRQSVENYLYNKFLGTP